MRTTFIKGCYFDVFGIIYITVFLSFFFLYWHLALFIIKVYIFSFKFF